MKFWVENMVKEQYEVRFAEQILLDFILSLEFHIDHTKRCNVIFNWPEIWCRTFIPNKKNGPYILSKKIISMDIAIYRMLRRPVLYIITKVLTWLNCFAL